MQAIKKLLMSPHGICVFGKAWYMSVTFRCNLKNAMMYCTLIAIDDHSVVWAVAAHAVVGLWMQIATEDVDAPCVAVMMKCQAPASFSLNVPANQPKNGFCEAGIRLR
jgi:hypothetical protein